ncbi:hypothetical protein Acr_05g0012830 [Actinidia rufa]|uniref:Uncharacterized protein n=1 Tax=Actinidia rufa TaxID=165716 RepID=A0A7J0EMD4_9ERIC|nr:hypothetical protein Acr_05g0012830 [Actinidia rufa]
MRGLVNLKFRRETTVAEHTSEFQNLVNQLTSVDLQFDDGMQTLLLLSYLPESWETLVVSFNNSAPNGKLTTSMVMDALFNEEDRRRDGFDRSEDCPKYKDQDQSSDTTTTAVMAVDEDEIDIFLATSHARDVYGWRTTQLAELLAKDQSSFRMADGEGNKEMLWGKKIGGLYRLEGSVQTGGAMSDMGSVVLARRVDKGSNRCTEVLGGSVMVPRGSGALQERREMLWDMYGSLLCVQERRDGATTTRKVTNFAAHPGRGCKAPQWGVQGTSVRRCRHFGGKWSSPLMRLRHLGCCLAVLWGSWIRSCQEGQLEDIGLPFSGLEGEIVESNPSR